MRPAFPRISGAIAPAAPNMAKRPLMISPYASHFGSMKPPVPSGSESPRGVEEEALTTKETFLEDWRGLPPRTCLATSAEEVMEEEEIKACAAIFGCVIFAAGYCGEKQPNLTTDKIRILVSNENTTRGMVTGIRDIDVTETYLATWVGIDLLQLLDLGSISSDLSDQVQMMLHSLKRRRIPPSGILIGLTRRWICTDGGTTVMSFGDGSHGALGLPMSIPGLGSDAYEPTPVPGLPPDVTGIAAGHFHSLSVTREGHVYAWGRNTEGTSLSLSI
nr:ultraviolet-B receptor UVR8 [Ipomoea batatas]